MILTGILGPTELVTHLSEFGDGYLSYRVDHKALVPLQAVAEMTEIVVLLGTWCPDCHREIPHFIRIIETLANPHIQVTYIGLDLSKQDPQELSTQYEFTRIPTLLVHRNGKELGRIVERPEISLESDLAQILRYG
jgi:thiol-disulfide isomerase/thioredoxin